MTLNLHLFQLILLMSCRWLQLIIKKAHKAPQLQVTSGSICKHPASKQAYFPVEKALTAFTGLELDIHPWYFSHENYLHYFSIS